MTASARPLAAGTASPPSRAGAFLALAAAVTAWGIGWPVNRGILYYLPPFRVSPFARRSLPRHCSGWRRGGGA